MKRPHTGPVIICSCSYVWRAATLCVSGERDWLCQRERGEIREAMVWKIKEMPLMEKYRMCRGRKAKKEPTVTPPLFCLLSFLSAREHGDVAAAFWPVYIKRATTKETDESDMDLICI